MLQRCIRKTPSRRFSPKFIVGYDEKATADMSSRAHGYAFPIPQKMNWRTTAASAFLSFSRGFPTWNWVSVGCELDRRRKEKENCTGEAARTGMTPVIPRQLSVKKFWRLRRVAHGVNGIFRPRGGSARRFFVRRPVMRRRIAADVH